MTFHGNLGYRGTVKTNLGFAVLLCLGMVFCAAPPHAQSQESKNANPNAGEGPGRDLTHVELTIDGVAREALVYAPASAKTADTPVVFAFHGHGGSALNAARTFAMDRNWPEAISVYMQGLNTPGRLVDPNGEKAGWQSRPGDQGDRDFKFFDAMLARLKQDYKVDAHRIYSTGHSNGGGFTYLLWAERGEVLAAVAPCAAIVPLRSVSKLTPKPAMHIAGKEDALVQFAWQRQAMDFVKKLNGCAEEGTPWAEDCTLFSSKTGTPLVEYIHSGGHVVPPEAPKLIVKFFREHPGTAESGK